MQYSISIRELSENKSENKRNIVSLTIDWTPYAMSFRIIKQLSFHNHHIIKKISKKSIKI